MKARARMYIVITATFLSLCIVFKMAVGTSAAPLPEGLASNASPAGTADLVVVDIKVDPPDPGAGTKANITPVIKNQGDAAAATLRFNIYVEPADDPPTTTTKITKSFFLGIPIDAGATYDSYTITDQDFTQNDPQICVWVDPQNEIAEADETNNLFCIKKTIEPPVGEPDTYEEDDACANAKEFPINGAKQERNLYRQDDKNDEDWVKLTVQSGVTYIAEAVPVGNDAKDLAVGLHSKCDDGAPPTLGGTKVEFKAPESKEYYLRVYHTNETYGSANDYTLTVVSFDTCSRDNEPNDLCQTPVDYAIGNQEQTHLFCTQGDVDWVRFEVQAGGKYQVTVDDSGSKADTELSLYAACDSSGLAGQKFDFTASAAGHYYVKVNNSDPNVFGPDTSYKVKIEELERGCKQDQYENDDTLADAQPLVIDVSKRTYNTCPKADIDWVKIEATKGTTFTVETYDLMERADTELCLHDVNGQKLVCDRDSGAGKGARLIIGSATEDVYYFSIRDENPEVAGDMTQYKLRAITGLCTKDSHEPNDERAAATSLPADGTKQEHNICNQDDGDWTSFSAQASTSYIIKTDKVGPEGDTEIELYDAAGNRLARNDDYTPGVSSQLVYEIQAAGTYYVKTRHYNPTQYGSGTEYTISVEPGTVTVTPPPPPPDVPPGTPEPRRPEPNPNEVRTLILVNRARIAQLYSEDDANQLMNKLEELARHARVKGEIIQLDKNQEVSVAYAGWTADAETLKSASKANQVTNAIHRTIIGYLQNRSSVEYILLVGDDRALPFRRVIDNTELQPEKTYTAVTDGHPTGAAIRQNHFLSDDYYAARQSTPHKGRELYIPDFTTGRLIESPSDMTGIIDAFLASNGQTSVQQVLVTGYDFVKDSAAEDCITWRKTIGEDKVSCLIGENWTKSQVTALQLRTENPFKIQSINGHADHYREGVPSGGGGGAIVAGDIIAIPMDLSGGLIYTLGCHGGLNVPNENGTEILDLPEAFIKKKANYVGNTGFGWGYLRGIGLSEQLMQLFTAQLVRGGSMGKALTTAKRTYYQQTRANSAYDEKVMQELIFYGLPMYETPKGLPGDPDPFPGVTDDFGTGVLGPDPEADLTLKTVNFDFTQAVDETKGILGRSETEYGDYLTFGGHSYASPEQPIQPLYFRDVTLSDDTDARSIVLRGATVSTVTDNFDAVVATPDNEFVEDSENVLRPLSAGSAEQVWYPPLTVDVQTLGGESTLTAQLGQYNAASEQQRIFSNIQVDIYYSTSSDQVGPEFTVIDALHDSRLGQVRVKVGVTDASGIQDVILKYFEDAKEASTNLKSLKMTFEASSQKWIGSFSGSDDSLFFVSAVDRAGNVTTANNKGENYRATQIRPGESLSQSCLGSCIYLPEISS